MATLVEIDELVDAMGQLLDDMGADGTGVCLYAKAKARIAFEPFRELDDEMEMSLTDAQTIIRRVSAHT